jgi:hypothetical protein
LSFAVYINATSTPPQKNRYRTYNHAVAGNGGRGERHLQRRASKC